MAMRGLVAAGAMAAMLVTPTVAQQQQPVRDPSAVTLSGAPDGQQHAWTTDQLLTSTVHEAWLLSGRNEGQFFEMVKELAAMSAQKRGLVLPETDKAGKKAGELIKKQARKDPDQLLYAVVDRAVMETGKRPEGSASAVAATK